MALTTETRGTSDRSAGRTVAEADAGDATTPDICVIINAGSGKGRGAELADELESHLAGFPDRYTLRLVRHGSEIEKEADRAVQEGFSTIVAAGGDGTICAVASRLAGTGRQMGVLPLGTFNYFARGLSLPEELEEAVRVVTEGHSRTIHVGDVNGRVFLNNASLGAYAAILQRREKVYRRWGRSQLAAYWSVLLALFSFRSMLTLKVTVDGEVRRFRTPMVFVANNPYQLELFELDGVDCVRSGQFALFVAPDCGRFDLIRYALRLAFHSMVPDRDFELLCGSDILVEDRRRRRLVARDGEREYLEGPFRFHLRKDALQVLVPAGPA